MAILTIQEKFQIEVLTVNVIYKLSETPNNKKCILALLKNKIFLTGQRQSQALDVSRECLLVIQRVVLGKYD